CLLLIDRRRIGAGFTRLLVAFTLASLIPGLLLIRAAQGATPGSALGVAFAIACVVVLVGAGRLPHPVESALLLTTSVLGAASLFVAIRAQIPHTTTSALALAAVSCLGSTLVLGLVVGAMILGHWYLVTPDLPVEHLGRVTRAALIATYA